MSHTFRGSQVTIHHDGYLGGDVRLLVAPHFASIEGITVSSKVQHVEIALPIRDLLNFVAETVRSERIGRLENATPEDLLGLQRDEDTR